MPPGQEQSIIERLEYAAREYGQCVLTCDGEFRDMTHRTAAFDRLREICIELAEAAQRPGKQT